jgi:hypothetical protein
MSKIELSPLRHSWILDLDGTICKHNGYLVDGHDTLLPGVKDFMASISGDFVVIVTARDLKYKEKTIDFLRENNIHYDAILFGAPTGERILINDKKPSGLIMGYSLNLSRNEGLPLDFFKINPKK